MSNLRCNTPMRCDYNISTISVVGFAWFSDLTTISVVESFCRSNGDFGCRIGVWRSYQNLSCCVGRFSDLTLLWRSQYRIFMVRSRWSSSDISCNYYLILFRKHTKIILQWALHPTPLTTSVRSIIADTSLKIGFTHYQRYLFIG